MHRSLTNRIIILSVFWIVIALLVTALLLGRFYRSHIEEHYDSHVSTHVEELIAAIETGPQGELMLSREPTDPRFHRPDSGWYWEIVSGETAAIKSSSLGEQELDLSGLSLDESHDVQTVIGPGQQNLRAQVAHVSYPHDPGSITFIATSVPPGADTFQTLPKPPAPKN